MGGSRALSLSLVDERERGYTYHYDGHSHDLEASEFLLEEDVRRNRRNWCELRGED